MAAKKTALVAGATGVAGRNLLQRLAGDSDWDVIALSRRKPAIDGHYRHIAVDLLDAADARAKLGGALGVSHIFYAAYVERKTWADMVAPNLAMLANVMDAVEPVSPGLAHVHLMHGTKWYGSHLGPFKTPAKEDDARALGPNFYYDQQDFIAARQKHKNWNWSAARPHAICGFAVGNPMNLVMVLAVYATLCKELGLPFCHPGADANFRALYQVTDSDLLAHAMVWMATDPACANQAFNITNGDLFRWENLWPRLAAYFGLPYAERCAMTLAEAMADKAPVWDRIVARHHLQPIAFDQVVSWAYGDFVFGSGYDVVSSTIKARQYGFQESMDSEDMFMRLFDQLRVKRIIP